MLAYRTMLALGLAGGLSLGCGSSSSSAPPGAGGNSNAGAGGSATGGSATGGAIGLGGASAGGTGGSTLPLLGNSAAEACIAYAIASCERRAECEGTPKGRCIEASFDCPDVVLSSGSTRTPAVLKACADSYSTFSCDLLLAGKFPPCVSPGTKKVGEPCLYPSQCESLTCPNKGACGVCSIPAALGEDCTAPGSTCVGHTFCGANGKCLSSTGNEPGATCGPNDLCRNGTCKDGLCVGYPGVGGSCEATNLCAEGAFCDASDTKCKLPAAAGQPCFEDADTGALPCAAGSACHILADETLGTCDPPPAIGQPCGVYHGRTNTEACGVGNRCNTSVLPAVCASKGAQGEFCKISSDCASSSSCLCGDGTTTCEKKVCSTLRFAGESCDLQGNTCHPAFACAGGKCVPSELRGNFEKACSPTP